MKKDREMNEGEGELNSCLSPRGLKPEGILGFALKFKGRHKGNQPFWWLTHVQIAQTSIATIALFILSESGFPCAHPPVIHLPRKRSHVFSQFTGGLVFGFQGSKPFP